MLIDKREIYMTQFYEKMNFYIEDYQIDELEYIINVSLASIYMIIHKKDKNALTGIKLFLPQYIKELSDTKSLIIDYSFIRNKITNDYSDIDEKLKIEKMLNIDKKILLDKNQLSVHIKSYNQTEFIDIIKTKGSNDIITNVKNSLISHTTNNISFILANVKSESLHKQDRLIFKTFDKQFNIEIIPEKYSQQNNFLLNYIRYMKSNRASFLPFILGVFKIEINKYKNFTIILTKNKILENIPRDCFNYWQMLKITSDDTKLVTSSKNRISFFIKDEQVILKPEIKLILTDYPEFQKILRDDLLFLKNMNIVNFSLVVMYYEFGKMYQFGQAEDEKAFSIRYSSIQPNRFSKDYSDIKSDKNEESKFDLTVRDETIFMKENFGFEAAANDYKCLMFFVFDGIDINPSSHYKCGRNSYYDVFYNNMIEKFDDSILK
jgi:hypothetical protein